MGGRASGDQACSEPSALITSGTTVSSAKAGRVQSTKGNSSRTGTRRAASSAWRRRSRRASSPTRVSTASNGVPSRSDASRAETLPRFRRGDATQVHQKSSAIDLVTEADEQAERMIHKDVAAAGPDAL